MAAVEKAHEDEEVREYTQDELAEWSRRANQRQLAEMPFGASPCTESIVSHVSWKCSFKNQIMSVEPGRLFFSGMPRNVDPRIQEMLQPIFSHINRDDHSERAAFLHVVRAWTKRCGFHDTDACSGWIRLFITHFPCISCLAVTCQFVRFFPAVRLQIDFDNMWKTRYEPADKAGSERFHREGGLSGRRQRIKDGFYDW